MSFLELLWPAVVTIAVLGAVGGILSWAVGLRGLWSVALAPAFALTIIGGTAVIAPWVGMPWSLVPVLLVTVVVAGAIYAVRRATTRGSGRQHRPRRMRSADRWLIGALILAAALIAVRVLLIIQEPQRISQTFDNIFHLNGIRYILDGGNASSLRLGYMTSPDGSLPFYPAAWHDLVSLVIQLSGASIPVGVNAVVLVTSAVLWPVGIVLLVRALFGRTPAITVSAALLATAIPAFPLLLMDYGVLYPFQLGLALLPAALAATLRALALVPRRDPAGAWWWVLVLVGVIPGMTLAHPGAFVAWLALTVPMALTVAWRSFRAASTTARRWVVALVFAGYLLVGMLLVIVLRPPSEARGWPPVMSIPDALWQTLSVSMWYLVPAVVAGVAVVLGIVWAIIDRSRSALLALGMYLIAVVLFVIVAALPFHHLRDAFTGSWYNNLPRLAAILAIAMVPMGAYGLGRTWVFVLSRVRVRRVVRALPGATRVALGVIAAALLALAVQGPALDRAVEWASATYRLDADSPLLSADEYALIQRIPEHVPEGVMIAGSPFTGTSLAYALAGRPVLMPHTLMVITDEVEEITDDLDEAAPGSPVCRTIDDLGIGFVLDFGEREVHPGTHPYPGFDDLADSDAVRLVDSQGEARLYEIVACG